MGECKKRGEDVSMLRQTQGSACSTEEVEQLRHLVYDLRYDKDTLKAELADALLSMSQTTADQRALNTESIALRKENDEMRREVKEISEALSSALKGQTQTLEQSSCLRTENGRLTDELADVQKDSA